MDMIVGTAILWMTLGTGAEVRKSKLSLFSMSRAKVRKESEKTKKGSFLSGLLINFATIKVPVNLQTCRFLKETNIR